MKIYTEICAKVQYTLLKTRTGTIAYMPIDTSYAKTPTDYLLPIGANVYTNTEESYRIYSTYQFPDSTVNWVPAETMPGSIFYCEELPIIKTEQAGNQYIERMIKESGRRCTCTLL